MVKGVVVGGVNKWCGVKYTGGLTGWCTHVQLFLICFRLVGVVKGVGFTLLAVE